MSGKKKDVGATLFAAAWIAVCVLAPATFIASLLHHDSDKPGNAVFTEDVGIGITRRAVPGGWVYRFEGGGVVFVPEPKDEQR